MLQIAENPRVLQKGTTRSCYSLTRNIVSTQTAGALKSASVSELHHNRLDETIA
jgi:hypothetical protein